MIVKDICTNNVAVVDEYATIRTAAEKMAEKHLGSLVIVDDVGVPHGIITDRDITRKVVATNLDADTVTVAEIMAHPVVSVRSDAKVETALTCMTFGIRRVPVVDDKNRLVGIVCLDDFLERYANEFEQIRRILTKEFALEQR